MRFTIIAAPHAPHQVAHQQVLAEGLAALGHEAVPARSQQMGNITTQHVACWGWRLGATLRRIGHEVLVMERGYLGDRFAWTSLAWNGLNGRGNFGQVPDDGGARFRQHFSMAPWRKNPEGYVLIAGQVPGDASLQGKNLEPWYAETADRIRGLGLEPMFRPHPQALKRGLRQVVRGVPRHTGSLAEALAGARQVVTYNSNTGVDAVLAGVPLVADNEGSMAWPVSGTQLGELHMPPRERWAHDLAWKQWSLAEIRDGTALRGLL